MSLPNINPDPDDDDDPTAPKSRLERRRDKIVAEIEANRRGEYTVPTWVLTVILLLLLGGLAAIVFL